jgi:hypothetical protein
LLLSRYKQIEYILELGWVESIELTNRAIEEISKQKDWEMWLTLYPNMNKENFIPFDKFRKGKTNTAAQTKKPKTKEEILQIAENTRLVHQGKHKGIVKEGG